MQTTVTELDEQQKISLWVNKAQSGGKNAFALLYKRYGNYLYLFCRRLTGDENTAEEIVQEAFIKAWVCLPQFRNDGGFYSWLRQIASRLIIDRLRQRDAKVWNNVVDVEIEDSNLTRNELERSHNANYSELMLDLEKLIEKLPVGARTVLVLYEIEGYKHSEIGQLLGIAEGTSKAQLARARNLLKANFVNTQNPLEKNL